MIKVDKFTLQNPSTPRLLVRSHFTFNVPKLKVLRPKSQNKLNPIEKDDILDKQLPNTTKLQLSSNKKAKINHNINEFQVELSHCYDKINALSPRILAKQMRSDFNQGQRTPSQSKLSFISKNNRKDAFTATSNQSTMSSSNQSSAARVVDDKIVDGQLKLSYPKDGYYFLKKLPEPDQDFPKQLLLPKIIQIVQRNIIEKKYTKQILLQMTEKRIYKEEEINKFFTNFRSLNHNRDSFMVEHLIKKITTIISDNTSQSQSQNKDSFYQTSESFKEFLNQANSNSSIIQSPIISPKTKNNKKITFEKADQVFDIDNNNIAENETSQPNPDNHVSEFIMDSNPMRSETVMSNDELDDIDIENESPHRPNINED